MIPEHVLFANTTQYIVLVHVLLYWNFPKRLRFSDPPSNVANPILKTLSPIIIFSPDISWPTFGSRPSRASSYEHVAAPKVWGKIGKSTLSNHQKNWGQWENLQRYNINHLKIGKCSVAICAFHPRRDLRFCNHQLQILQSKVFLRCLPGSDI